jgi:hypothetical protein
MSHHSECNLGSSIEEGTSCIKLNNDLSLDTKENKAFNNLHVSNTLLKSERNDNDHSKEQERVHDRVGTSTDDLSKDDKTIKKHLMIKNTLSSASLDQKVSPNTSQTCISTDPVKYIPGEVWQMIFDQSEPSTLLLGQLVSKSWYYWIDNQCLWKKLLDQNSYEAVRNTEDVRLMGTWQRRKYPLKNEEYFIMHADMVKLAYTWMHPKQLYLLLGKIFSRNFMMVLIWSFNDSFLIIFFSGNYEYIETLFAFNYQEWSPSLF